MAPLFELLRSFLASGGPTMWLLFAVTAAMWALLLERKWYQTRLYPRLKAASTTSWQARADRSSWYARKVKNRMVYELVDGLGAPLPVLRGLIAICPLLGLLGTVLGMLELFDAMAQSSPANMRNMAAGISQATISTMAGMVAALSGLYGSERLRQKLQKERRLLDENLRLEA